MIQLFILYREILATTSAWKREIILCIYQCCTSLQAAEQQGGGSGDFQEGGHSEKEVKGQLIMDTTLEDKICDLYDIFVDVWPAMHLFLKSWFFIELLKRIIPETNASSVLF